MIKIVLCGLLVMFASMSYAQEIVVTNVTMVVPVVYIQPVVAPVVQVVRVVPTVPIVPVVVQNGGVINYGENWPNIIMRDTFWRKSCGNGWIREPQYNY